jgi:DNA-binding Xre family transcriptional regulator
MPTWNKRLEEAMEARGKKRTDLARIAEVTPASVSDWISGKTKMMEGQYAAIICDFLRINPMWLFHKKGPSGLEDGAGHKSPSQQFREALELESQVDPYELIRQALRVLVIVGSTKDQIIAEIEKAAAHSKEVRDTYMNDMAKKNQKKK